MMRPYLAMFRLSMAQLLQYRTAAIAGIATQFCFGVIRSDVLGAFIAQGGGPLSVAQTTGYVWLGQALLLLDHRRPRALQCPDLRWQLRRTVPPHLLPAGGAHPPARPHPHHPRTYPPCLWALGKADGSGWPDWACWGAPLCGVMVLLGSNLVWQRGVRRYTPSGS